MESANASNPLNFIAEAYWQDYLSGQPIDGGVAHETLLRLCKLDSSVASLADLDALLDHIRSINALKPSLFMADEPHRKLVLFMAFYAGRILSHAWQMTPQWLPFHELARRYPKLPLNAKNPFHFMALPCPVEAGDAVSSPTQLPLFFALEPIARRLFVPSGQPMLSVTGEHVANGLYEAVFSRLPAAVRQTVTSQAAVRQPLAPSTPSEQTLASQMALDNSTDTEHQPHQADLDDGDMQTAVSEQFAPAALSLSTPTSPPIPTSLPNTINPSIVTDPINTSVPNHLDGAVSDAGAVSDSALTQPLAPSHQAPLPSAYDLSYRPSQAAHRPVVNITPDGDNEVKAQLAAQPFAPPSAQNSMPPTHTTTVVNHDAVAYVLGEDALKKHTDAMSSTSGYTPEPVSLLEIEPQPANIASPAPANTAPANIDNDSQANAISLSKASVPTSASTPTSVTVTPKVTNQSLVKTTKQPTSAKQTGFEVLQQELAQAVASQPLAPEVMQAYAQLAEVAPSNVSDVETNANVDVTQALAILQQVAQMGDANASLRLAMATFLGQGMPADPEKGWQMLMTAANNGNAMAQRQISRMYFQGLGQPQDMALGRHWLEKAADNGHAEAMTLLTQWNLAQTIMEEQKSEEKTDKRYLTLIGIVLVVCVIIIIVM